MSSSASPLKHLLSRVPKTLNREVKKMASWPCSRCTFLNPPSQKSNCQICLSPSSPLVSSSSSSSSSSLRWSCTACTFSNPLVAAFCEMCGGTRASRTTPIDFDELGPSDADVGSVFFPLRRCGAKKANGDDNKAKKEVVCVDDVTDDMVQRKKLKITIPTDARTHTLRILSYNVWFREDLEVYKRMEAIGDLIKQYSPDVICFQEVTPKIYEIFQNAAWWKDYKCSFTPEMAVKRAYFCVQMSKLPVKEMRWVPFSNSIMGRELSITEVDTETSNLVVATSHLESPCPAPPKWDQMYSAERVAQANFSMELLKDLPNVIFCGDMNWEDKLDGPFPLPEGWVDAWSDMCPNEIGLTFDTKSNPMLLGNRLLQRRLDRFICKLANFRIGKIEMVGREAIPGISYVKEKRVKGKLEKLVLPVLPSDHYGLLLTIERI